MMLKMKPLFFKVTHRQSTEIHKKKNAATHTNYTTAQLKIAKNMALADAGATGQFVLPGTPVTNIKIARHPLKINLPDGDCLTSTHICTLDIPWLPNEAKEAHIFPGLAHASLISIKILCDAGCKVTYDNEEMPRILQQESSVARKKRTANRIVDITTHRHHPPTKNKHSRRQLQENERNW